MNIHTGNMLFELNFNLINSETWHHYFLYPFKASFFQWIVKTRLCPLVHCLQICQFPWDSQGWCSAGVSDCLPGAVGYNQTVAPAETEPEAAHDHSHAAASLDWHFRLPGGHDHHVPGLLHRCEQVPTHRHQHAICCEIELIQDVDINTGMNCLLFSQTSCMGGSYTLIGLCWMLHRPWSACSLAFLTTKRFVKRLF